MAVTSKYAYDETFYRYIQGGAIRSAQVVVPFVVDRLKINNILDVGCGAGAWLVEYYKQGILVCMGVDGDYVKSSSLLIPSTNFVARDISQPFDLGRRFDLVQCLEVGEHIEPGASKVLVANLVRHSDNILFSAAVPGQGGENHINEQPYEFWRALFAEHGYVPYDFLRPLLRGVTSVESWYRHNTMLYVANHSRERLLPVVVQTQVPEKEIIVDVSSFSYKFRKRVLSVLPVTWLSRLAVLKHRFLLRMMTNHQYN
jgi:hypothetical protein